MDIIAGEQNASPDQLYSSINKVLCYVYVIQKL